MRILIATGLYAPEIGGPATYTAFLERHLPSLGFSVEAVPFSKVRHMPKILRHICYTYMLIKAGRTADALLALDAVSVGLPASIARFFLRKRLYVRVPGDYAWEQAQQRCGIKKTLDEYLADKHKPLLGHFLGIIQRTVLSSAYKIVVPSEYLKQVVESWGIEAKKITVIQSALHPTTFRATREELRSRFGYEGLVVTSAGRLVPWKGMDALIETIVTLRNEGLLVSLDIIGDGEQKASLSKKVIDLDADSYIHLLGRKDKQSLAEHIKASDVFVLNTSYEGFSHQLLEVMDIGTPIVTTPVGGNIELIRDRENGLLVPYNDKEGLARVLHELHTDGATLRDRLVKRAQQDAQAFSESHIVDRIAEFFRKS